MESALSFQTKLLPYSDLTDGRPTIYLTSRQLLERVLEHPGCQFAPAHLFNPYFSSLGSKENHPSLQELFGDLAPHISLVEMGLTSNPGMCRRLSDLDAYGLLACSDAHSPEKIGREYTLIETIDDFDSLFAALCDKTGRMLRGTVKFPIERTRYFLNYCSRCKDSYSGIVCPKCKNGLAVGSRDRVRFLADRESPDAIEGEPQAVTLLPLHQILSDAFHVRPENKKIEFLYSRLISLAGNERFILTEATYDVLAEASISDVASSILKWRKSAGPRFAERESFNDKAPRRSDGQTFFSFE